MTIEAAANQLSRLFAGSLNDLRHRPRGQLPALDVLRTCAVLIVVWGHTLESYENAGGIHSALGRVRILGAGWIGVNLFFVLSGYLIGLQLWRELATQGTIDFWRFFLRRGFRIWPLYFFFLVFVLCVLGRGDFLGGQGWSDAVFLTNYLNHGVVMGSWSLCTEEQFYLLAPLALIVSAQFVTPVARYRRYLWIALLALPAIRALTWCRLTGDFWRHDPGLWNRHIYQPIHSNCDGLLMGLILANLVVERGRDSVRGGAALTAWVLLLASCIAMPLFRGVQREVFNLTGMTFLLGSLVWLALQTDRFLPPEGFINRAISGRVFYWLSRLSYGMYLNHSYLHAPAVRFTLAYLPGRDTAPSLHLLASECIVAALSAAAAVVTYCLIEHPFLVLRDAFVKPRRVKRKESLPAAPEAVQLARY